MRLQEENIGVNTQHNGSQISRDVGNGNFGAKRYRASTETIRGHSNGKVSAKKKGFSPTKRPTERQ